MGNNVDTKGAAYALALQHLTIGIYIGEICLAGLFGINKSWPHLGLMLFFILVTAIWQITMNAALKPQQKYLPDDLSNHKSYDFKKAGAPPTEASMTDTSKLTSKKASIFSKLFDPSKFKSHSQVKSLVPDYPPPQYTPEEEAEAYY